MKNKKILLVIVLIFVLILVGASVLYNRLSQGVQSDQMIVHATAQPEESEPEGATETETSAETTPAPETGSSQDAAHDHDHGDDVIHAPDFTVYDADGNPVQLSQFFGKPIVLNFWASWCGPCQSEMPDFDEKYAELGEEVNFLMVNMTDGGRETVETASAFISKNGYSFPVYYDTASEAAMTYGAYSLPTSYFIDAGGHVIAQAVGAIDGATLQEGIDMITN